jgi:hypothetical protein
MDTLAAKLETRLQRIYGPNTAWRECQADLLKAAAEADDASAKTCAWSQNDAVVRRRARKVRVHHELVEM